MGDMSEYYKQISEIQKAVREREMYRLELEKERLLKAQRREKRHEELRNKIKALHKELVSEELEASQRVRKLLAKVEAVTREHKMLEAETEKLRNKKHQYEAMIEKNCNSTKSSYPNYLNLLQTANAGSLGINIPGILPQVSNTSSTLPQAASTPVPVQSMSTVHPFPAAVPQLSPITLSNQFSNQQPGTNILYGNVAGNTSMKSATSQAREPHLYFNINQQEELATMNSTLSNSMSVSSAPIFMPGVSTHIMTPYQQNHLQTGQPYAMANSSTIQGQSITHSVAHQAPQTQQIPKVSFTESNLNSQNFSPQILASQHLVGAPSDIIISQEVNKDPTALTTILQRQESAASQNQGQENLPLTNYQQQLDYTHTQVTGVPDMKENVEVSMKTTQMQVPSDPSHIHVGGTSSSTNSEKMIRQHSEEASTSTGLPTRPTITGLSEVQSIDSAHASNEITEESLPPSSQEHSQDIPLDTNIPKQRVTEITIAKTKERTSDNISKSDIGNLPTSEKNKNSTHVAERTLNDSQANLATTNTEGTISGKDVPKSSESKKVTTTDNMPNSQQVQKPSQPSGSKSETPSLPVPNNENHAPSSNVITKQNENLVSDSKSPTVQKKKDPPLPTSSEQKDKKEVQSLSRPSVPEVKKSNPPQDEAAKKPENTEKEKLVVSQSNASKAKVSQPSVSSLTDSSSTMETPSLPTKTSLSKTQAQDDENDSDFFDRDVPITSTPAYKAMVSGTGIRGPTASTESDSDDLEGQMNAMIAKQDPLKSRPMFKPFASSIPSLRPPPPGTDTDSVDSVEAAIQAAMSKSKENGGKAAPAETSTASNPSENTPTSKETAAAPSRAPISKPRPSAALQINLDSDSESGGVSAGAEGSDDDDFDFYD